MIHKLFPFSSYPRILSNNIFVSPQHLACRRHDHLQRVGGELGPVAGVGFVAAALPGGLDGNVADTMPSVTKQQMIAKYTCISVTSVATPASDSDSVVTIEVLGR